jgi:integrase
LKKNGRAEWTLLGIAKRLRMIAKDANIDEPEKVKEYIASKKTSNTYKEGLVQAYDHYVRTNGLTWQKPIFVREENSIKVPTTENIEKLIAYAGPKYSTIISVFKDTGARPCELEKVRLKDIDLEQGIIYLPSRKGSRGRPKKLKPQTLAMLKAYVNRGNFKFDSPIFPSGKQMGNGFRRQRDRLARKIQDPTIRTIRLYDLRHYHATMLYLKTKDIVYCMQEMGHRRLANTLKYVHLVNFKEDEWTSKVARTLSEACSLIDAGFDYVTDMDSVKIFRKRK